MPYLPTATRRELEAAIVESEELTALIVSPLGGYSDEEIREIIQGWIEDGDETESAA